MKRVTGLLCALVVAGAACGATIVHDAGRDLVLNSRSAFVYTNAYGGVWSYMSAASYQPSSPRTLLTDVRYYTNNVSSMVKDALWYDVVLMRGPSIVPGGAYQLPVIAVNQGNVSATSYLTAAGFPDIPPGQIALHPGARCAVLRFTMPRDAVYTVTARIWNQNIGLIGMSLQTNGVLTQARQVWKGSERKNQVCDLSLPAKTFKAGDWVELVVDDDAKLNSNAAGVTFEIAEEVLGVIDAGTAMHANMTAASPANPYTVSEGAWQAFHGKAGTSATNFTRNLLATGYVRSTQGSNARGFAVNGGLPWCVVNATGGYVVETNAQNRATFCQGRALAPDELMMHPQDQNGFQTVGVRFTPDANGIYDIGVTARDLSKANYADAGSGVNVWLLQGLQVLAKTYVSLEHNPSCDTIFLRGVPVLSEIPVEVVVDAEGDINSDSTGITFAMVKTCDIPPEFDASAALRACFESASPANPFQYNGCEWAVGTLQGGFAGTFTAYPLRQDARFDGFGLGWGENTGTSPYMGVNMGGKQSTGTKNTDYAIGRGMLYAHPRSDNSASCIRFTAARRGLYKATAWFKDLNAGGTLDNCAGVDVHILTNGLNAASRVVSGETGIVYGGLDTEPFELRRGGTVSFAIGANGAYHSDMTGFHAWVECLETPPSGVLIVVR